MGESEKLTDDGGHAYEEVGRSNNYIKYERIDQDGGGGIDSSSSGSESESESEESESEDINKTETKNKIKGKTYMTCVNESLKHYKLYDHVTDVRDGYDRYELLRGKYIARQDIREAEVDKDEGKVYGEIDIYEINSQPIKGYTQHTYQAKYYGKLTELLDSDDESESD